MQNNIAVLLPYKDQFIKDNAGSASIWVKDFSKESKLKKNTTIFGYTSNVSKTFDNFNYVNLQGQILPGLSIVTGDSDQYNLPVVTFPGNLGNEKTLLEVLKLMDSIA